MEKEINPLLSDDPQVTTNISDIHPPKQREVVQQNLLSRRQRNHILVLGTVMIHKLRPYRSESFKTTVVFVVADCFVVLTLFIYLFIYLLTYSSLNLPDCVLFHPGKSCRAGEGFTRGKKS